MMNARMMNDGWMLRLLPVRVDGAFYVNVVIGILFIKCPLERVVLDICSDSMKICVVADDVLIISALPNRESTAPFGQD